MGSSISLGEMFVTFKAKTDELTKGMDLSKTSMSSADSVAQSSSKNITSSFTQAGNSIAEFGSKTATGAGLAQSKLALLDGEAQRARGGLQQLAQEEQQAGQASQNLSNEASRAGQALQSMASHATSAGSSISGGFLSGIRNSVSSLLSFGSQLGMTVMGMQTLVQGAVSLASGLLGPVSSAEQLGISFTTLMGSADAAKTQIRELGHFADVTPFEPGPVQQYAAQLIGMGLDAKDTIPIMTSLGDALFGIGHGTEAEMKSVVDQIGKIRVAGVMTWGDISQLQTHGINVLDAMSRATGKSKEELRAMSSSGIEAGFAIDALTRGIEMNPLYQGGMAKQASSTAGIISTLTGYAKNALNSFLGLKDGMIATGSILDRLKTGLSLVGTALQSPAFQNFASGAGALVGKAFDDVGMAATYTFNILRSLPLQDLKQGFDSIGALVGSIVVHIQKLGSAFGILGTDADPVAAIISNLANGALTIITPLVYGVSSALMEIDKAFATGKGPLAEFAQMLGGQFKTDLQFVGNLFNQVGAWVQSSLVPALSTLIPPIVSIATTIVTTFLPAFLQFHNIALTILPIITGAFQAILPPIVYVAGFVANILAGAFRIVGPLVLGLAVALSMLTDFFFKTELGGALLKATLIALAVPVGLLAIVFTALAVQAVAAFIASIPAMVAGFVAGAGAAWTMAAGIIALTWPVLAVIAAIALVILAIQHWSDIVNWAVGLWQGFANWWQSNWDTILNIAKIAALAILTILTGGLALVVYAVVTHWTQIQQFLATAWEIIVNIVQVGGQLLLDACMAPIRAIVAGFQWLYDHNYYFQALIDTIVNIVSTGLALLQSGWQISINWLIGAWQSIVGIATSAWNAVSGAVQASVSVVTSALIIAWNTTIGALTIAWNAVVGVATSSWNAVTNAVSVAWNAVIGAVVSVWNTVSGIFANAWNTYIAKPLADFWGFLQNTWNGWVSSATNWGANLIQGFVNGIVAKASNVAAAVGGIAGQVLAFLGFHSPTKEGAGREADQWAPAFVDMFSSGLEAGIPKIQSSLNLLMQPMFPALVGPEPPQATSAIPAATLAVLAAAQASQQQQVVVHVHVPEGKTYIDGREMAQALGPHLAYEMRVVR